MQAATCPVASCNCGVEGSKGEGGLHPVSHGIAHDAVGPHVFDGAEVELPFSGRVLAAAVIFHDCEVVYVGIAPGNAGAVA